MDVIQGLVNEVGECSVKQILLRKAKKHLPREISKHCLKRNQKEIIIRDVDLHEEFKCIIKTTTRMEVSSPFEKYMTKGWYNFVKTKGFRNGDTLICRMTRFSPYVYVTLKKK
ncbi:hypothetical protein RYX36_004378 [Vicia faba]